MRLILIMAGLFLAGALYNLLAPTGNAAEGVAGLAIASLLVGLRLFLLKQDRLNRHFLGWLFENAAAIMSGGSLYDGVIITSQTEISQYQAALSFLIITIKVPSRFHIVDRESSLGVAWLFTFVSLVFGWWGIPWGTIYTIQSIFRNLKGGHKQKVGDLLAAYKKT
jgi:hypothetical protein